MIYMSSHIFFLIVGLKEEGGTRVGRGEVEIDLA